MTLVLVLGGQDPQTGVSVSSEASPSTQTKSQSKTPTRSEAVNTSAKRLKLDEQLADGEVSIVVNGVE